jgi:hypothetical protein
MSNLLEKASIVLTPTAYDNGVLYSIKPVGGENLLLQSNQFDTTWGVLSINTPTNGFTGYDGLSNAWKLTTNGSSFSRINQSFDLSNIHAASVYAKRAEWDYVGLYFHGVNRGVVISLIDGTVQNPIINYPEFYADAEDVGNGWYRISIAHTLNGSGEFRIYPCETNVYNANSTSNEGIYIQDAQLEKGTRANKYTETTTSPAINGDFSFTRGTAATRVNSQGLVENVQMLSRELVQNGDFEQIGSELVTNGDFATDSNWNLTGATISGGKVNVNSSNPIFIIQNNVATVGKQYKVELTVSDYVEGDLRLRYPFTISESEFTGNGTYFFYGTADDARFELQGRFSGQTYNYSIDNVSVKEVGQNWSFGTGWSMGDGKAIFNGGNNQSLSQDGIVANNKKYKLTYTISNYVQGGINWRFGTSVNLTPVRSANGTYVEEITATGSDFRGISSGASELSIDNVSVIEITDDTNLPRIDYSPYTGAGTCGHWLFEPQSNNLFPDSQDFSQVSWNKTSVTVSTSTITDPTGGQNSFKLVPDSGTGGNRSLGKNFTGLSGLHTQTVFAKKGEYNYIMLRTRNAPISAVMFDLENGTFNVNVTSAAFDSAKIEDYGNGWFRCSMTLDPSQMTISGQIFTSFSVGITGSETNSFNGDGTSGIYVFGAQFEEKSFPTSYIPTNGTIVPRNQDLANNSGSSDLINSTEGVLYAEIASLNEILEQPMFISLSNATTRANTVEIGFNNGTNRCRFRIRENSSTIFSPGQSISDITQFTKIAMKYKSGDNSMWIDGVKVDTDTSTFSFTSPLSELNFDRGDGADNFFFGKVKCVAVFKEALTDAELTCLTS